MRQVVCQLLSWTVRRADPHETKTITLCVRFRESTDTTEFLFSVDRYIVVLTVSDGCQHPGLGSPSSVKPLGTWLGRLGILCPEEKP